MNPLEQPKTMGTWPVFLTAISTILGAILFLRFGYSIAHIGLFQTLLIILLGHMVNVPAALAVAEIATNQKVEGGGDHGAQFEKFDGLGETMFVYSKEAKIIK